MGNVPTRENVLLVLLSLQVLLVCYPVANTHTHTHTTLNPHIMSCLQVCEVHLWHDSERSISQTLAALSLMPVWDLRCPIRNVIVKSNIPQMIVPVPSVDPQELTKYRNNQRFPAQGNIISWTARSPPRWIPSWFGPFGHIMVSITDLTLSHLSILTIWPLSIPFQLW